MDAVHYVDTLFKEYLLFRGFTSTLSALTADLREDKVGRRQAAGGKCCGLGMQQHGTAAKCGAAISAGVMARPKNNEECAALHSSPSTPAAPAPGPSHPPSLSRAAATRRKPSPHCSSTACCPAARCVPARHALPCRVTPRHAVPCGLPLRRSHPACRLHARPHACPHCAREVRSIQVRSLVELLDVLNTRFYSRLDSRYEPVARSMETALLRLALVTALRAGRRAKVRQTACVLSE